MKKLILVLAGAITLFFAVGCEEDITGPGNTPLGSTKNVGDSTNKNVSMGDTVEYTFSVTKGLMYTIEAKDEDDHTYYISVDVYDPSGIEINNSFEATVSGTYTAKAWFDYSSNSTEITITVKTFEISPSIYGSWYCSLEYEKETWIEDEGIDSGKTKTDIWNETYTTATTTDIMKITKDSVYLYYSHFRKSTLVWVIDSSVSAIADWPEFATAKLIGGKVVYEETYTDEEETEYYKVEYSPYFGSVPPTHWKSGKENPSTTTPTITIGETKSGTLSSSSDLSWFKISCERGKSYQFEITKAGFDTYMTFTDSDINVLDTDDDGGNDSLSAISFNCSESGVYYIAILSYSGSGSFTLTVKDVINSQNLASRLDSKKRKRISFLR